MTDLTPLLPSTPPTSSVSPWPHGPLWNRPHNISLSHSLPTFSPKLPSFTPSEASLAFATTPRSSGAQVPSLTTLALASKSPTPDDAHLRHVVDKGFLERPIREDMVYHIMEAAWKTEEFHIEGHTSGIFIIDFVNLEDKVRVVTRAPWFVVNKPFVLRD